MSDSCNIKAGNTRPSLEESDEPRFPIWLIKTPFESAVNSTEGLRCKLQGIYSPGRIPYCASKVLISVCQFLMWEIGLTQLSFCFRLCIRNRASDQNSPLSPGTSRCS